MLLPASFEGYCFVELEPERFEGLRSQNRRFRRRNCVTRVSSFWRFVWSVQFLYSRTRA